MNISENGLKLIASFEALHEQAYPDPGTGGSPWTLGYGHTEGVKEGDTCTADEAMEWLKSDAATAERCVNNAVIIPVSQNQFDAMTSLCFNIGCGNFKNSGLVKVLNGGNYRSAAPHFMGWNKANGEVMDGLTRRRQAEMDLFLGIKS